MNYHKNLREEDTQEVERRNLFFSINWLCVFSSSYRVLSRTLVGSQEEQQPPWIERGAP